jgi:hypothetical protein
MRIHSALLAADQEQPDVTEDTVMKPPPPEYTYPALVGEITKLHGNVVALLSLEYPECPILLKALTR